jgi:hypothetical protein
MNLLELITYTRTTVLNDVGGNVALGDDGLPAWVTDDSSCLWSNALLTDYANQAEREYCRRLPIISDDVPEVCEIELFPGVNRYPLHPCIQFVINVSTTIGEYTRQLRKLYFPYYIKKKNLEWSETPGTPKQFTEDGRYLLIFPSSDTEGAANLTVARFPLQLLRWAYKSDSYPEIKPEHQHYLAYWIGYLAYQVPGSDTFNPGMSGQCRAQFESAVGASLTATSEYYRNQNAGISLQVRPWGC